MRQRASGCRPRAEKRKSIAERPNERWATDLAYVPCGLDGYAVFAPVIDCCTREVLGWELARTGRASTAARALEDALLVRFGTLRGAPPGLKLRHDNGLVFGSREYVALARDYSLTQESIAPHTPEQNGLCERFIRTFKEECVWLHTFTSIADARTHIATFITYYNTQRFHQALKYTTPFQNHKNLCRQAA